MKRKTINSFVLVTTVLFLTACGSDSKVDGVGTSIPGTTGLSIAYESTEYDGARGFIDHYRVHATDVNGNPVSGLPLNMSIINGVKEIRNQKLQIITGNIESSTPINFFDNGVNFSQTDVSVGDNLIIIPSTGKTNNSYLGDWRITSVGTNLTLGEASYNLESTGGLTYIIGNEKRFLGGSRGRLAIAHIETPKNTTDADGFTYFDVIYDPVLGRHTVTLGVHTDGDRMSSAKVASLRGGELVSGIKTFQSTGGTYPVSLTIDIMFGTGGTEHFIDKTITSSSFKVDPIENCHLNVGLSDFHTDSSGRVYLAIDTQLDVNATEAITCTVSLDSANAVTISEY